MNKRIGLIDVDGHNFPNLALMKLSSWHRSLGDVVEWWTMYGVYDIVYKAKVFTFTDDFDIPITNAGTVISGGTGYNIDTEFEFDRFQPDLTLYTGAQFHDPGLSYGFTTRGCVRRCSWCVVPKKEGGMRPYMEIDEVAQGNRRIVLMDNNILAIDFGLDQIKRSIDLGFRIDLNQGVDARLIVRDVEIAKILSAVHWLKPIRLACDSMESVDPVIRAVEMLRRFGCRPTRFFVYVLLTDLESSYERINILRRLNLDAFAQPFRDFTRNQVIPQWQRDMARYTNVKSIYRDVDFKDFEPRKGFKCGRYFVPEKII